MPMFQSMNSKGHWDSIESLEISRYVHRPIIVRLTKQNEQKQATKMK